MFEGEAAGEDECLWESIESPGDWKSAEVPWERVREVDSGISVSPLIFKSFAVSSTCQEKPKCCILIRSVNNRKTSLQYNLLLFNLTIAYLW